MDRFLIKSNNLKDKDNKPYNDNTRRKSELHSSTSCLSTISTSPSTNISTENENACNIEDEEYSSDSDDNNIEQAQDHDDNDTINSDSDSTLSTKKRVYKQKFRDVWCQKFIWLDHKGANKICKVCNIIIQGSGFHLKRHDQSVSHQKKYRAAIRTPSTIKYLNENNEKIKLSSSVKEAELKMSAYLCEHNLPFRLVDSLPSLCTSMFPDSAIASGLKIKRKKATKLVSKLADTSFDDLISHLQKTEFSLIIDETTDVSTHKSLVIVARFWESKEGKVKDKFLSLLEVEDATAQGLFNLIKINILDKYKIPDARIIGFAADNASVMMGNINGVQALLKTINPNIIVMGCTSHSLHLCASQAAKKLPNCVEQFARDIYNYFAHSSKRLEELKKCQIFVTEKPTKILYPSQTRWLSLRLVVDRILCHWDSLKLFFQGEALGSRSNSNAKALLVALENPIFKVYFLFLSYVLELVTKINLEFQSENSKFPVLLERVSSLYKIVLKSFIKRDILNSSLNDLTKINIGCPHSYKKIDEIYFGAKVDLLLSDNQVKFDLNELKNFKIKALDFYIELCKEIAKRFNFNDPYLKYASLFVPQVAISGDILSIAKFKHLFPNINADVELVNNEWQLLSEMEHLKKMYNSDLTEFWRIVSKQQNSLNQPIFSNLMKIVKFILTLPHSSAVCERLFSWLTLIKTKQRNKLLIKTCNNILHVKDQLKNGGYNFKSLGKKSYNYETDDDIDMCDIFEY